MKQIIKKWTELSLIFRIVMGLILGAILGLLAPNLTGIGILGTLFVGALKGAAPILVFALVASSIAGAGEGIGSRFRSVITLYIISSIGAAALAVLGSELLPVSMQLTVSAAEGSVPSGIGEVLINLVKNAVQNPVAAIAGANYIGILFWAIIFGFALQKLPVTHCVTVISDASAAISQVIRWIIQMAPFGILGLVFSSVAENGMSIFADYGKLLGLLVGCMLVVALVLNPLIVGIYLHKNPYPLVFRCLRDSGITAFFTRSSAANVPVNMALCERLGLEKDFYSVSIPLGCTINMCGAAVTIAVMTLAVANTLGIHVDLPTACILCVMSAIGACGTSGIAGGSLFLIPMTCSILGISSDISMQAVAVGFILSVIQDSMETALNSSSDVIFTATAEYCHRKKTIKNAA